MTEEQTIKVLELLNAFYAGGKNDPQQQVIAWHLILKDYDFQDAMNAVLTYAKNDRREYAQFPTVGRIIEQIEAEQNKKNNVIREVINAISYGRQYDVLSDNAKELVCGEEYNSWLNEDAEEFSRQAGFLAMALSDRQERIVKGKQLHIEGATE